MGRAPCGWMVDKGRVCCPHCHEMVQPKLASKKKEAQESAVDRSALPQDGRRVPMARRSGRWYVVTSPAGNKFDPHLGNAREKGRFVCPHCGNNEAVIESVRSLPDDQLLPMHAYGLQAYAAGCDSGNDPAKRNTAHAELFGDGDEQADERMRKRRKERMSL